jgi:hypothetical protein
MTGLPFEDMRPWTAAERASIREALAVLEAGQELTEELAYRVHVALLSAAGQAKYAEESWSRAPVRRVAVTSANLLELAEDLEALLDFEEQVG